MSRLELIRQTLFFFDDTRFLEPRLKLIHQLNFFPDIQRLPMSRKYYRVCWGGSNSKFTGISQTPSRFTIPRWGRRSVGWYRYLRTRSGSVGGSGVSGFWAELRFHHRLGGGILNSSRFVDWWVVSVGGELSLDGGVDLTSRRERLGLFSRFQEHDGCLPIKEEGARPACFEESPPVEDEAFRSRALQAWRFRVSS